MNSIHTVSDKLIAMENDKTSIEDEQISENIYEPPTIHDQTPKK